MDHESRADRLLGLQSPPQPNWQYVGTWHSPRSFLRWHFENVGSSQGHVETLVVTQPAKRSDRQIFKRSRVRNCRPGSGRRGRHRSC